MKVSEIMRKAMLKEIRWLDAARILGISDRQMRRWKRRLEADGPDALRDHREGKVPSNRVPEETVAKVLALYRDSYAGFNVQHFWEQLEGHDIDVSYSWTKALLHEAGLVKRGVKRKAYRRQIGRAHV